MARLISMAVIGLILTGANAHAGIGNDDGMVAGGVRVEGVSAAGQTPASRSVSGFQRERGGASRRDPDLLKDFATTDGAASTPKHAKAAAAKHLLICCDFWIFDAWVELFDDIDRDGHYTYFRVGFDVDTALTEADVYTRLFLRGANGVWNLIYESEVFPIFGSSGSDDYEVETELVAGYPTGDYDVLIEVYDAYYDELVVEYGPAESSALSYVPLEDVASDGLTAPPVSISSGGGGGAVSLELLGLMLAAAGMQIRGRRRTG
ncbi:MAG: choice-of-anchor H family protein [Gammaproteobacteria bacterium]|nr:MAG: choice-of-anchor H family protein [Gammaproteobacteria bacterium]